MSYRLLAANGYAGVEETATTVRPSHLGVSVHKTPASSPKTRAVQNAGLNISDVGRNAPTVARCSEDITVDIDEAVAIVASSAVEGVDVGVHETSRASTSVTTAVGSVDVGVDESVGTVSGATSANIPVYIDETAPITAIIPCVAAVIPRAGAAVGNATVPRTVPGVRTGAATHAIVGTRTRTVTRTASRA